MAGLCTYDRAGRVRRRAATRQSRPESVVRAATASERLRDRAPHHETLPS